MSATVQEIVNEVQEVVGEVPGPGTQAYGEDGIRNNVIRMFNMFFKKAYWPQFLTWDRLALDGTNGIVTIDAFLNVRDFEDFLSVNPDGKDASLPRLPFRTNPYVFNSGTSVRYWTSLKTTHANYLGRRLLFYPLTSTGFVNVQSRVYPVVAPAFTWGDDDVMDLDKDMLVAAGAYLSLSGDDLNAAAANVQKEMMESRYKIIRGNIADMPIATGPRNNIPTDWYYAP